MLKKPTESQPSKIRPSSRTPARPTHIRTNSQSGNNQSAAASGRRRRDTNEDPSNFPPSGDATVPPAVPPRTTATQVASSRSAKATAPEHSFLTDVADVRDMEKGLLSLLDDFHSGKLQAFGCDDAFKKMDAVREQQEQLARMHFRLDQDATAVHQPDATAAGTNSTASKDSSGISDENMDSLLTRLHALSQAIQDLHPEASVSQMPTPLVTQASSVDQNTDDGP